MYFHLQVYLTDLVYIILSCFLTKIMPIKINLGRREFSQFLNLSGAEIKDEDIFSYSKQLDVFYSDFNQRFEIILKMKTHDWNVDFVQVQAKNNLNSYKKS